MFNRIKRTPAVGIVTGGNDIKPAKGHSDFVKNIFSMRGKTSKTLGDSVPATGITPGNKVSNSLAEY